MKNKLILEVRDYKISNTEFTEYRKKLEREENIFYKYRTLNYNNLSSLIDETIYLSEPEKFNDPFDCYYAINSQKWMEKIIKNLKERKKILPEIVELQEMMEDDNIEDFKEKYQMMVGKHKIDNKEVRTAYEKLNKIFKICSLSKIKDSILMWSHYSENHYGYCLELEISEVKSIYPVFYSKTLNVGTKKIKKSIDLFSALVKSDEWKYEEEYRLVREGKDSSNTSKIKIRTIYLGTKCEKESCEIIEYFAKIKGIEVKKLKISENEFKLVIDEEYESKVETKEKIQKYLKGKLKFNEEEIEKIMAIGLFEKIESKKNTKWRT